MCSCAVACCADAHCLLIEIGGHGNNLNEALYAGQLAANGLIQAIKNAAG